MVWSCDYTIGRGGAFLNNVIITCGGYHSDNNGYEEREKARMGGAIEESGVEG